MKSHLGTRPINGKSFPHPTTDEVASSARMLAKFQMEQVLVAAVAHRLEA